MVRYSYFKHASKDEIERARLKGLDTRRSPGLKKAWKEKDKIKQLYEQGINVPTLCKMYGINYRSCYRIIKHGKDVL